MILPTRTATNQGWQEYCEYLHHGLSAIKRRLGLQRYNELAARLDAALTTQLTTGSTDGHLARLVPLLEEYYDPMYRYQLEKKRKKLSFAVSGRKWRNGLRRSDGRYSETAIVVRTEWLHQNTDIKTDMTVGFFIFPPKTWWFRAEMKQSSSSK